MFRPSGHYGLSDSCSAASISRAAWSRAAREHGRIGDRGVLGGREQPAGSGDRRLGRDAQPAAVGPRTGAAGYVPAVGGARRYEEAEGVARPVVQDRADGLLVPAAAEDVDCFEALPRRDRDEVQGRARRGGGRRGRP
ncbi:hypothetical protein SBADM41S_11469 [Streptomyces badius]